MAVTLNYLFSDDTQTLIKNNIKMYSGYYADNWIYKTVPNYSWTSIAVNPENGFMVAVASNSNNNVMYSSDGGVTWNSYLVGSTTNNWKSVTYGNGRFVAVGSGTTNYVMYSTKPNPILLNDWVLISSGANGTANNSWEDITFGANTFIAVASSGSNRIMYSTNNGVNWTTVLSPESYSLKSITYGNGYFVAVSSDGLINSKRIIYSLDNGKTWYNNSTINYDTTWNSITYSPKLNLFVILGGSGTTSYLLAYSSDIINWTGVSVPSKNWSSVSWSQELEVFVAIANASTNGIISSPDGVNWITRFTTENNDWKKIIWNRFFGEFNAISSTGTNKIIQTKSLGVNALLSSSNYININYFNTFNYGIYKKTISIYQDFFISPILNIPNNDIFYEITPALPSGISINQYNGIISGNYSNLTLPKDTEYTVTATNFFLNQKLKSKFLLNIINNLQPLNNFFYNNRTLIFNSVAGKTIYLLPNIGGSSPITFSISPSLPSGLLFDIKSGLIYGTISSDYNNIFTITATNPLGSLSTSLRIINKNIPPSIFNYNSDKPVNKIINEEINLYPSNNTGTNLTYSITPTPMIGTLTINSSNGNITGTLPSSPISVTYTITATNSQGSYSTKLFLIVSNPQITGLTYNTPVRVDGYTYSGPYNFTASVSTGANLSFSLYSSTYSAPSLPVGFSFNKSNGNISGNPTSGFEPTSLIAVASSQGVASLSYSNIYFNIKVCDAVVTLGVTSGGFNTRPGPGRPSVYIWNVTIGTVGGGYIETPKFHNSNLVSFVSYYSLGTGSSSFGVSGNWTSNPGWSKMTVTSLNNTVKTFTIPDSGYYDSSSNITYWNFSELFSNEWYIYEGGASLGSATKLKVFIR